MSITKTLDKQEFVRKISKQLSAFGLFGGTGEKRITKKQLTALLKRKNYQFLKKEGNKSVFVKKTWPDKGKQLLSSGTNDFSVVVLFRGVGSEGRIDTRHQTGGLYDGGEIKSYNELYHSISKSR